MSTTGGAPPRRGPGPDPRRRGPIRLRRAISGLEGATLRAEGPLRRLIGSNRLNPLPHAGTISVFLLGVVTLTGLYLTLFFQFGYEASYESVLRLEAHPVQRVVRAVHRYSSAGLVLTTVVHAWRTFVMARFGGPRRWRWLTGVAALLMVWLAGVTGYWLIWDERAQALTEATVRLLASVGTGMGVVVNWLATTAAGSGWQLLLVIWLAHLLLTGVIGWLLWRHLRRTHHRWLPPRHWMWAMAGALVVVSAVLPAGMLRRADPGLLVGPMPLDPFVMFLLPLLLRLSPWWVLAAGAVVVGVGAALPWLLRRSDPDVVAVDPVACTGCELCVVDCPYEALTMGSVDDRAVAVVDASRCVACGICLGSCAFAALTLPGFEPLPAIDPAGEKVVLACERHLRLGSLDRPGPVEIRVSCAGMVSAQTLVALADAGAASVQVVGCPPGDCAYGLGNEIAAERLAGTRRPHLPRRWREVMAADWVPPTRLSEALAGPGRHPAADPRRLPAGRRRLVVAVAVVVTSIGAVAAGTLAPFRPGEGTAEVAVVIDHVPGAVLEGAARPSGSAGVEAVLEVVVDGETALRAAILPVAAGEAMRAYHTVAVAPGRRTVEVRLLEGRPVAATPLLSATVALGMGERLVVEGRDLPPPPGVAAGRELFSSSRIGASTGCSICHSLEPGDPGVGPALAGVATRAADRVAGLDAEAYLRQSILDPDAYVVEGFRAGQMLPIYGEALTAGEVDALVAFLLTLR